MCCSWLSEVLLQVVILALGRVDREGALSLGDRNSLSESLWSLGWS